MSDLPEPIEKALAQTNETQAKLASGVQELAVTNAVLQQEIPEDARTDDVALAIKKNEALENRVQECVDDLEDVSQALSEEVERRKKLERELKKAGVKSSDSTAS
ncbi:MAG: hypothetical protein EOO26_06945 [Comamonadaceae bacterium]|nr:MAG: hypothetical protein EOO26_06945 [Comamonadaceae bacterium]